MRMLCLLALAVVLASGMMACAGGGGYAAYGGPYVDSTGRLYYYPAPAAPVYYTPAVPTYYVPAAPVYYYYGPAVAP